MNRQTGLGNHRILLLIAFVVLNCVAFTLVTEGGSSLPNLLAVTDDTGVLRTYTSAGRIDMSNPFFKSLGTNGRSCVSCHTPSDAWTVTPAHIEERFEASQGTDPIFRPVDGANCPSADVSTVEARRQAYSNLLNKGLIRVSMGVPDGAEFKVTGISDPNHCPQTTAAGLALFRRPLPATNLAFLSTVMWDGRETFAGKTIEFDLTDQASGATTGHAQATSPPSAAVLKQIVEFEYGLSTAQASDNLAGSLSAQGATGGPVQLSKQPFTIGINAVEGASFNPQAMTIFGAWANLPQGQPTTPSRGSIARGEAIFNSFPIHITGVSGLNDAFGDPYEGTCTTCHDTPNVGNHSVSRALNIGVTDYPPVPALDISGLPVYTIQCKDGAVTPEGKGATIQTTDPGRALVTGKCVDIGKMKGPILRGLAARAPYFHNGSAKTLLDVVHFYEQRFGMNLTAQQEADLVAFLRSL